MAIEFDPAKRLLNLEKRGLDFADAIAVIEGPNITIDDDRFEYSEKRMITFGNLANRLVVIVWTQRGGNYRIISMRKANDREQKRFGSRLD
ncbi:MAG: BrnT family toxin [Hyphomicrobiales bacterium]